MKLCIRDEQLLRDHLIKGLRALHFENETYDSPCLEGAACEGGIAELELIWETFLEEDVPSREVLITARKLQN